MSFSVSSTKALRLGPLRDAASMTITVKAANRAEGVGNASLVMELLLGLASSRLRLASVPVGAEHNSG